METKDWDEDWGAKIASPEVIEKKQMVNVINIEVKVENGEEDDT